MFTGIVTDMGEILEIKQAGDLEVRIGTSYDVGGIDIGASIACDGVCLTVVDLGADPKNWFLVQASAETLSKTNLDEWAVGRSVNLERALKVGDEIGGHIVSGHVDGVGKLLSVTPEGASHRMVFSAPANLGRFIASKGSVTIDGISLTVNEVADKDGATQFGVNIIPHTWAETTLGQTAIGDSVNLEIDLLARYVARLAEAGT